MSNLQAIILIVKSSRGHHFVFQYPANLATIGSKNIERKVTYDTVFGFDNQFLANLFSPKPSLYNKKFYLSLNGLSFIGLPCEIMSLNSTHKRELEPDVGITVGHSELTMFHLVYVWLDVVGSTDLKLMDLFYENIVKRLTKVLNFEQTRNDYIRKNTDIILGLTEESINQDKSVDVLMSNLLSKSSLAKEISQLYIGLVEKGSVHLNINNYFKLSLQLSPFVCSTLLSDYSNYFDEDYKEQYSFPKLRPYHSMIFFEDKKDLINELPLDFNLKIRQFIQLCCPNKSFMDLHLILDLPVIHIYRIASHLVYHKKGKIINTINPKNVYIVSPKANFNLYGRMVEEFNQRYPQYDMTMILKLFSTPKAYSYFNNSNEQIYMNLIGFLLIRNWLIQIYTFIYFMIPRYIKLGNELKDIESLKLGDDRSILFDTAVVSDPKKALKSEANWINKVSSAQPKEIASLFLRLVKYFNGNYHVDEIIFFENITKKDLKYILTVFRDSLITVLHYDKSVI